jgi:hypothetical protein
MNTWQTSGERKARLSSAGAYIVCVAAGGVANAQIDLYSNGPFITHPSGGAGGAALSAVDTSMGNTRYGVSNQASPANDRVADDFTLASAAVLSSAILFQFQTNAPTGTSTITSVNLRVWSGRPGDPGAQVIFGDTTTNRLVSAAWTGCYRAFDTSPLSTDRPIFALEVAISPPLPLPAGTYWLDWQATGTLPSGPFAMFVTIPGLAGAPDANARYKQGSASNWINVVDGGSLVRQELAFIIRGTGGGGGSCYANCDGSSGNPLLTANDFQCFLNKYASGDPQANCDASTGSPLLTANDFQCFLNRFAAGCS